MNEFDADRTAQAIQECRLLPAMPAGLSLKEGYALQQQVTKVINDSRSVGWKAGITDPEMQAAFGLSEPLIGSLYRERQLQSPATIELTEDHQIECEVCIAVDADWQPRLIAPAIEFVRLTFTHPSDLTPANAVVANVGADRFLVGDFQDFDAMTDVPVKLEMAGEELLGLSTGIDAVTIKRRLAWFKEAGDRHRLARSAADDHLLLLGTMGQAVKAIPGKYRAVFGQLGTVEFDVLQL